MSDVIFLSDASVGLGWSHLERRASSAQNLFDSKYKLGEYNYASDFQKLLPAPTLAPERSFTAGAPRDDHADALARRSGGVVMRRARVSSAPRLRASRSSPRATGRRATSS